MAFVDHARSLQAGHVSVWLVPRYATQQLTQSQSHENSKAIRNKK